MKKNIEMIKWKLCEGYFSIIGSNLKDEITFDELIFVSKVSGKDAEKIIPPYKWIAMMKAEIAAGAWKVIAEARESGTVGIFRNSGEIRSGLIEEILQHIPLDTILWEAPQKVQQVWFLTLYGHNVNLGNIAPHELIPLETLRLGLRGDTFSHWL